MFNQFLACVLVCSFHTISMGQFIASGRQATADEVRIEQSILANIRPLVMQHCSCEAPTGHSSDIISSTIQTLTNRIVAIEKSNKSDKSSNTLLSEIKSMSNRIEEIEKIHGTDTTSNIPSSDFQDLPTDPPSVSLQSLAECIVAMEKSHKNDEIFDNLSSEIQNISNRIEMIEKSHGSDNTSGILSSEIQELAKRIVVIEKLHDTETSSVILSSEIQNLTERIVAMERSHYIETTSDILSSEIQNLTERIVAMERSHYIETTSGILSSEIQNLTERIVAMEKSSETDRKPDIPSLEIQNLANRIEGIENILQQNVTRRLECIASFENLQSNLDVQMFDGRCYFIGRQYLSWSKTQAKCQLAGANLVTDPSQRLIDFLTEVIENHFWIGARKTNIGSFQWITNGETVYWNDRRWDGNHPYYNERNQCVYVNVGRRKWRDYDCNHRYNYVCQL